MLRLLPIFLFSLLISGCGTTPEETGARPQVERVGEEAGRTVATDRSYTFVPGERFGPFVAGMDTAEMKRVLGPEHFTDVFIHLGEGQQFDGLALYPDRDARVEIIPSPEDLPADIEPTVDLIVRDPGSPWQMADTGIGIGSSLRELERVNGKPFKFQGFDWDYSGQVYDWNGGRLEGLGVQLGYEIRSQYGDAVYQLLNVWGDAEVSSDDGIGEWLDVRVREIRVAL